MTGIWVIAHECGHHAFTPHKQLNNVVGFIFHTMLLVPYFSWQYTHAQHHARTNNLEEDTNHLPRMKFAISSKYVLYVAYFSSVNIEHFLFDQNCGALRF